MGRIGSTCPMAPKFSSCELECIGMQFERPRVKRPRRPKAKVRNGRGANAKTATPPLLALNEQRQGGGCADAADYRSKMSKSAPWAARPEGEVEHKAPYLILFTASNRNCQAEGHPISIRARSRPNPPLLSRSLRTSDPLLVTVSASSLFLEHFAAASRARSS